MITYKCKSGTAFISNSDLSDDVIIVSPEGAKLTVPCQDVFDFIADNIRSRLVERIENLALWELLMHNKRETTD